MRKLFKKNSKPIENWEDKLVQIKETLEMTDNPMSYTEIEQETGLSHDEVCRIVKYYYGKITKESIGTGFPHPDFYLFGDNVKALHESCMHNFFKGSFKTKEKILDKPSNIVRGYLR